MLRLDTRHRLQLIALAALIALAGAFPSDRRAQSDGQAGAVHLAAGEFGAAQTALHAALTRQPNNAELRLRLARAQLGRLEAGAALETLAPALGRLRGARRAEAAAGIGRVSFLMEQREQARRWWEKALALDAGNRAALLGLAELADVEGDPAGAAAYLGALLARRPADAEAAYRLGLAVASVRRGEAAWAWRRAASAGASPWAERAGRLSALLDRSVDDAYSAAVLGAALLDLGELRPALRQFELATRLDPAYAEAFAYQGHILGRLGQPAAAALDRAVALDPGLVIGYYFRGLYYVKFGLSGPARGEFEAALALDRDNPALGVEIGLTYADEHQYAAAEEWLNAAALRAPGDLAIQLAPARFYVERAYRVAERGLPAADKLLSQWPDSAEGHELRGRALYLLGRYEGAIDELQRTVELAPQRPAARLYLGLALLALGRQAEGSGALERAASTRSAGEAPEGIESLERAIDLDPAGGYGRQAREYVGP